MPGIANISRYEHSLGTAFLASHVGFSLALSNDDRNVLESAALLHDSAITPFGHLAEEAMHYIDSGFDHQQKWSLILSQEDESDLGGTNLQILKGRESGLIAWAFAHFGGTSHKILQSILLAINGEGPLGPFIAGTIDLDNLDNVVRMAYHMGLRPDPDLPLRIAQAMRGVDSSGELIFEVGTYEDIQHWATIRETLYERLMPSPLDFCGKLMLLYATVEALREGVIKQTDWVRTDSEFVHRLLSAENRAISETVTRWIVGEVWDTSELLWMRGPAPSFSAVASFADGLSPLFDRKCFAYRIKDKRKRRLRIRWTNGEEFAIGETSDLWLLGVGSPVKKPFTSIDNRKILTLASKVFQAEPADLGVEGAKLF
jgi:HD superfamily phosphohydrolase